MNKPLTHSPLNSTVRLASAAGLMLVLAGSAAHAQTTQLLGPPANSTTTTTADYPMGDTAQNIYGPFIVSAGSTDVTYTATNTAVGNPSFLTFDNFDGSLDFAVGTHLVDTTDGNNPTGPLLISFSSGVSAFGIYAQDDAFDQETFTFSTYNGSALLNTFVSGPYDNTVDPSGKSVFLGAQTTGLSSITSVVISSFSFATNPKTGATNTANSNDFYVGPLSLYSAAPVPEASTTVSFGLLLVLGLGGALVTARKKMASASAA